jgi:hypothetical protein
MSAPMRRTRLPCCARRERPNRRAAEPSDEFAPSQKNAHLALPASQWIIFVLMSAAICAALGCLMLHWLWG